MHTTLVALGISVLIVAAPPLFLALKIAGAVYLLWLAYQAIVHGGGLRIAAKAKHMPTLKESFLTGVSIDLLNPKVVLFFVTFLPQFVDRGDPQRARQAVLPRRRIILLRSRRRADGGRRRAGAPQR